MYQVYTKIHTPVGTFTGYATGDLPSNEDACKARDKLQNLLRSCDSFTIFSDVQPGTEYTISEAVIKNSVFEFTVVNGLRNGS